MIELLSSLKIIDLNFKKANISCGHHLSSPSVLRSALMPTYDGGALSTKTQCLSLHSLSSRYKFSTVPPLNRLPFSLCQMANKLHSLKPLVGSRSPCVDSFWCETLHNCLPHSFGKSTTQYSCSLHAPSSAFG